MTADFAGRTALISGAGRGIGRAVAAGLADAGADLIPEHRQLSSSVRRASAAARLPPADTRRR